MDKEKPNNDHAVMSLLGHLSNLTRIAELLQDIAAISKQRTQVRHLEIAVTPGTDYPFKFDAESIYIDNITNTGAVTIQFDNEPLQFSIPASKGVFLPCSGSKQYRINGLVVSGSVNVLTLNRAMNYN